MAEKVFKTWERPEDRRRLLDDPPAGPFSRDSTALQWRLRKWTTTVYSSVFIPTSRVIDFLEGERTRGGCSFRIGKTPEIKKERQAQAAKNSGTEDVVNVSAEHTARSSCQPLS